MREQVVIGPYPRDDGWAWLYHFYTNFIRPFETVSRIVKGYLFPNRLELWKWGEIYRRLGVHQFGRWIPTGGINIRRATGQPMRSYTLRKNSINAAREFFYRSCVFETLHLPFALTLILLAAHRFWIGRPDLALENLLVNLILNVYPIMHQRYTRVRIIRLLRLDARIGVR